MKKTLTVNVHATVEELQDAINDVWFGVSDESVANLVRNKKNQIESMLLLLHFLPYPYLFNQQGKIKQRFHFRSADLPRRSRLHLMNYHSQYGYRP